MDAKLHLRVDFTDDDALISALITAARLAADDHGPSDCDGALEDGAR